MANICDSTDTEQVDFIEKLKGEELDIAEKVLSKLDIDSLKNAELVSKSWKKTITEGRIWEANLKREISLNPVWRQISNRINLKVDEESSESDIKNSYHQLQEMAKVLENNWGKGTYTVRGKRLPNATPVNSSEFFVMDDQWILIGFKTCGTIKVMNRKTLELEQDFPKHGPGLSFLIFLDQDTIMSASRKDGLIKIWDKSTRTLLKTITIQKEENAVVTELQKAEGLLVAILHNTSGDPWVDSKSTMVIWRPQQNWKELKKVHEETFSGVSVHHMGLDDKYIALMFLMEGRRNSFDLNLSPEIQFRSTENFKTLFTIAHGLEEVYEFKFGSGLMAVGSRIGVRVWDVEKRTARDFSDDRLVEGCGISVYGFNSKFIVGHLFSGPVLIWDLHAALKDPKLKSSDLLLTELKMRFDPDIKMDDLELVYLRRPHMQFLDDDMENYDAGDHYEIIIKDFLAPVLDGITCYEQCSEPCCLSDDDDYDM